MKMGKSRWYLAFEEAIEIVAGASAEKPLKQPLPVGAEALHFSCP